MCDTKQVNIENNTKSTNNETNELFKKWLKQVDSIVYKKIGLRLRDLPDEEFYYSWMDGMKSHEMAEKIVSDFCQIFQIYY